MASLLILLLLVGLQANLLRRDIPGWLRCGGGSIKSRYAADAYVYSGGVPLDLVARKKKQGVFVTPINGSWADRLLVVGSSTG